MTMGSLHCVPCVVLLLFKFIQIEMEIIITFIYVYHDYPYNTLIIISRSCILKMFSYLTSEEEEKNHQLIFCEIQTVKFIPRKMRVIILRYMKLLCEDGIIKHIIGEE